MRLAGSGTCKIGRCTIIYKLLIMSIMWSIETYYSKTRNTPTIITIIIAYCNELNRLIVIVIASSESFTFLLDCLSSNTSDRGSLDAVLISENTKTHWNWL